MQQRVPIGIDDFRKLREQDLAYVDKSHLIRELLDDSGVEVTLLPRPRRFGKTLNLSMLRCFLEKRDEDLWPLFAGLSIAAAGEDYRRHFQRYPVIHMTFKEVKAGTWELAWEELRRKIAALFREHSYLLDAVRLDEWETRDFRAVLGGSAERAVYESALFDLSRLLQRHHGAPVVVLIDEYDEPIHAGYAGGYAKEALEFFRVFLTAGLKGNPHLWKGVLTGILRVARESVFSGLNNLAVYSLLRRPYSTCFGFTEVEVSALLEQASLGHQLDEVRRWYNGYVSGDTVIYNPWSILNFIHEGDGLLRNHWVTTSSNDLVRDLLQRHALSIQPSLEALLAGDRIVRRVDESVALPDLESDESALFSLLVFSGYLRAERVVDASREEIRYGLSIPNHEVREVYATTFQRWLRDRLGGGEHGIERLKQALFEGDAEGLEEQLNAFTMNMLSYHDVQVREREAGPASPRLRVEQIYHAFVIGLLATLTPTYDVRSNRESGLGRPDVMLRPRQPGKPGVVLELKVVKAGVKTKEAALAEGLAQIRKQEYLAELSAAGASPVHAFVAAFDGKRVWVRAAEKSRRAPRTAKSPRARAGRGSGRPS